jgi:hypothetical protein
MPWDFANETYVGTTYTTHQSYDRKGVYFDYQHPAEGIAPRGWIEQIAYRQDVLGRLSIRQLVKLL